MLLNNNHKAFFSLIKAGLWEQDVQLAQYGLIDYKVVYKLAEEQSAFGLVAAGLEHVTDIKIPEEIALSFVGHALQLEQRNTAMNVFISKLIENMRKENIFAVLVKGQGIAQCYERPLWRVSGDIDLFLSEVNYNKAKSFIASLSSEFEVENLFRKHVAFTIKDWIIELHGSMRSCLWSSIDHVIDDAQISIFYEGKVRSWMNGETRVFLPQADEDVIIVFSHILQHFFKSGIGLRQVCDWCRLLWTFQDKLDLNLLESRIKRARMMTEWKAFASLVVNTIGMPKEAVPLYSSDKKWKKKADKIICLILETGNFGHNRDFSFMRNNNPIKRKVIVFFINTKDDLKRLLIFPIDSLKVWLLMLIKGLRRLI